MGEGAEFDTIRALMARWGDLAVDIGDDAAVLPPSSGARVISTDACVEQVHFQRSWITPREVGTRAAAAALSDLAAMGARPESVLIAFMVPDAWRDALGDVADGMGAVIREAGARIVGGNLSRGPVFSVTTTVLGNAARAVARRGARPGDLVVVTGRLGGPAAALAAWMAGEQPTAWARGRFAAPVPRWAEGEALAAAGATAMIDVSDGLLADAAHVAAASNVRIALDPACVPVGPDVGPDMALRSGEEYELLATLPPAAYDTLAVAWRTRFAVPLTVIGRVTDAPRGVSVGDTLQPGTGFDHFATP
jgi:thiamine-monophosphate kinase